MYYKIDLTGLVTIEYFKVIFDFGLIEPGKVVLFNETRPGIKAIKFDIHVCNRMPDCHLVIRPDKT